jgi:hypothetical protein
MSVQHPNMFPQPVTFRTQVAVTVLPHITHVAEVLFVQVQIHGVVVLVWRTDGRILFAANRYQRKSFSLTGAKVWNGI